MEGDANEALPGGVEAMEEWRRWCWPNVWKEMQTRLYLVAVDLEPEAILAERLIAEATAVVPQFLAADLYGLNCRNTRLAAVHPECVEVCGDWMIRPNPFYFDYDKFPRDLKAAKDDPRGFSLAAWWIHPDLQKESPHFTGRAKKGGVRVSGVVATMLRQASATADKTSYSSPSALSADVKYPFTAEYFDASHLAGLQALDAAVRAHMARVYGVEHVHERDMYFHYTSDRGGRPQAYRTAHLHVVHNRVRHPGCHAISCTLSAVIGQLEETGRFVAPYAPVAFVQDDADSHLHAIEAAHVAGIDGPKSKPPFDDTSPDANVPATKLGHFIFAKGTTQAKATAGAKIFAMATGKDARCGQETIELTRPANFAPCAVAAMPGWSESELLEEYANQLGLLRAGVMPQEQLDASPLHKLLCAAMLSGASVQAAQRASKSGA
jgi:hypothetical protein